MIKSLTSDPHALSRLQSMSSASNNSNNAMTNIELQQNTLMLNTLASLSKDGAMPSTTIAK